MPASVIQSIWTRSFSCPLAVAKLLLGYRSTCSPKASANLIFVFFPLFSIHQLFHDCDCAREFDVCVVARATIELIPHIVSPEVSQESSSNTVCLQTHRGMPRPFTFLFSKDLFCCLAIRLHLTKASKHWDWVQIPEHCVLVKILTTQVAETRATRFRTRATTTLRAVHINNRRNIHLTYTSFVVQIVTFSTEDSLILSSKLYDVVDTLVDGFHTKSKIPVRTLATTTSAAIAEHDSNFTDCDPLTRPCPRL